MLLDKPDHLLWQSNLLGGCGGLSGDIVHLKLQGFQNGVLHLPKETSCVTVWPSISCKENIIQECVIGWDPPSWGAALWEGSPGGQRVQSEWAVCCCCCCCCKESQQDAELQQQGHCHQTWRSHCPSLIIACQAAPGILCVQLWSPQCKKVWTGWGGSREGPTKVIKGLDRLMHEERLREKWICSALGKEGSEKTLSPCPSIYKVATKKVEIPF